MSGTDMPEPIDAIMPILQRIQADISAIRGRLDDMSDHLLANTSKLEAIEGYMTYHMGLTTRQGSDIEQIQAEIKAIQARMTGPETRP